MLTCKTFMLLFGLVFPYPWQLWVRSEEEQNDQLKSILKYINTYIRTDKEVQRNSFPYPRQLRVWSVEKQEDPVKIYQVVLKFRISKIQLYLYVMLSGYLLWAYSIPPPSSELSWNREKSPYFQNYHCASFLFSVLDRKRIFCFFFN